MKRRLLSFINIQSIAGTGASMIGDWISDYEDICYSCIEFCMLSGWGADLCDSIVRDEYSLTDELLNSYEKTTVNQLKNRIRLFLLGRINTRIEVYFSEEYIDSLGKAIVNISLHLLDELRLIKGHTIKNYYLLRRFFIKRALKNFFRRFIWIFASKSKKTLVMTNFMNSREREHIERVFYFFDNPKMIFITRDPRDAFITWINHKWLTEDIDNVNYFIEYYKKNHKYYPYNDKRILNVTFEDFVFDHEKVSQKILDFCEISKTSRVLNPRYRLESSRKNIGRWKQYPNQDVMKYIASELKDYLYEC